MKRTITHGPVTVEVTIPDDVPAEVVDTLAVDIDLHCETEELALASIAAFGGIGEFSVISRSYASSSAYLNLKGAEIARSPFEFTLHVPTGRERPIPDAPFIAELRKEQARMQVVAEVEKAKAAD